MDHLMAKNKIIKTFNDDEELFADAAVDFAQRAIAAVVSKNEFNTVLSGGATAKLFFDAIIKNQALCNDIPWQRIKFFFGDERYVPWEDPQSNYFAATQHLFSKTPVVKENIFPMRTDFSDPKDAAQYYETVICKVNFDLVYLGLGEDAHTASLMPGAEVLRTHQDSRLVSALWAPLQKMYRITLMPCAINHSACITFLVTGLHKADAVAQTLEGVYNPEQYPAQLIHCADQGVIWRLDRQAAAKLSMIQTE